MPPSKIASLEEIRKNLSEFCCHLHPPLRLLPIPVSTSHFKSSIKETSFQKLKNLVTLLRIRLRNLWELSRLVGYFHSRQFAKASISCGPLPLNRQTNFGGKAIDSMSLS
ncbi:Uncharacterized protein Fot_22477 [Forsythia ovata]|uniref:Maturase K n=1 Tax=Forsythia ovata TaxID=205694 RepID=A0ABD1UXU2_9LAMI